MAKVFLRQGEKDAGYILRVLTVWLIIRISVMLVFSIISEINQI